MIFAVKLGPVLLKIILSDGDCTVTFCVEDVRVLGIANCDMKFAIRLCSLVLSASAVQLIKLVFFSTAFLSNDRNAAK